MIAWGLTALIVYVFLDWWGQFTRPQWEETLEPNQFIILSGLFFAATFLAAIYIVQPLIYSIVHSNMSAAEASYHKNLVSPKTIDHIVYGVILGLTAGFIIKKVLIARTAKTSVAKTADIRTLLA